MLKHGDIPKLREYLDASGVLVNGTDEEIKAVRKEHRKLYKREHKRKERRENREVCLLLSRTKEGARIASSAKQHKMSIPAFLKKAALAYLDKTYIVPDRGIVLSLSQVLTECLNEVRQIAQSGCRQPWQVEEKYEAIEKRIVQLEEEIENAFAQPPNLEQAVHNALQKDADLRMRLLMLLTSVPNNDPQG